MEENLTIFEESYLHRFDGIQRLVGKKGLERLYGARVAVIGIGGVGSWTAEALVRSGVGSISLVDLDDICISNTNRQLHTLHDTIGRSKVDVMLDRLKRINPTVKCKAVQDFFTEKTAEQIITSNLDFVVDAIDSLRNKACLVKTCLEKNIPIITIGGAGGRMDPTQIVTAPLKLSGYDGLLRLLRKKLRKDTPHLWHKAAEITCIFSRETPILLDTSDTKASECELSNNLLPYEMPQPRSPNCQNGFGTASFVTGSFGFVAASCAVKQLLEKK